MLPFDQMLFIAGFSLAAGWYLFRFIGIVFSGLLAALLPRDDTDKEKGPRSGLRIYTDARTGVQYLGRGFTGPLTPRLDQEGYPVVGIKKDK